MYKDKQKQKEANRLAKIKQRQGMTKGMTDQGMTGGMTSKGVTLLYRPNSMDESGNIVTGNFPYNPDELLADGAKRYMGPLSDGQVLDNTTVGLDMTPRNQPAMKAWATATLFTPNKYVRAWATESH